MTTDTNTTAPRFTVTLAALRKAGACYAGYNKLVRSLQSQPFTDEDEGRESYIRFRHDAEIPLLDILKSNGLDDALWSLRCVSGADRDIRLFAVWCARQVEHLMQDQRSKDALDVAERFANGDASDEELAAAWAAAWAAARAAAWAAARAAAWAAAWDAARDAQAEMLKRMCLGTAPWQQEKAVA
ncbi:hypothetical protein KDW36_04245 [Burkholderia dolosa]|uniref:hypothetical protein n=1 Tax=Burkholderia dolosa TaxID=152500 RepID=UPI001B8F5FB3|nr:hypothetical protein [Burkholderia dolosa]MBR8312408.1 hypothetical protein [Burkholderia dolosa]